MAQTDEKVNNAFDEEEFPRSANNLVLDWIIRVLKGIVIGIGGILPGLSGGVLSVIFGVYDNIIKFLAHPFKKFWKNVRYFLPIAIGGLLGVFLFSKLVSVALIKYQAIAVSLFLGFVAGTLPALYKKAGKEGRKKSDVITMIAVAVVFMAAMVSADKYLALNLPDNFAVWLFAGALIGLGIIIPGLSPSNFLLYFNLYEKMTTGISQLNFKIILPLLLGLLLCVLLLAKLANYLFRKHYGTMYHIILGLVIGSTLAIIYTHVIPGITVEAALTAELNFANFVTIVVVAFVVGGLASYAFSRVETKVEAENNLEL